MPTDYSILWSKMLSLLPGMTQFSLPAIELAFKSQGIELDDNDLITVEQIIHELYFEGIVVPGVKPKVGSVSSAYFVFPHYHLTEYGEKVVRTTEYQPHDPEGYLARIRVDIPEIADVIIRYLGESLSCYRKNLLLAAAVMLGCAAEKTILLLVEAYGDSISNPADKLKYEKETKSFIISRKWDALWKRLEPRAASLPNQLGEDIGTIVERIFDIIRTTRNDAGHPTGKTVEKETVQANLLLFPIFSKRVYGLIRHFSTKPSPPTAAVRQSSRCKTGQ